MNIQLCVLLWSKYSPMSKKLLDALQSSPINLNVTVGLTLVCIDNEEIREQIMTANKIDISIVPCLLLVYSNGVVEKYEGIQAVEWCEETVKKYMPVDVVNNVVNTSPEQTKNQHVIYNDDYIDDTDDSVRETKYNRKKGNRHKRKEGEKRKYKSSHPKQKQSKTNTLSELDSDSDDTIEESKLKRPPVMIRNGPSSYDITDDFGETEDINRDMTSHTKPDTKTNTKSNDVMARATAMQKERENVDSRNPRPVLGER
jgi:hypothetical protein